MQAPPPTGLSDERKGWVARFQGSPVAKVLALRDFRILWTGGFLSFSGSWMQTVAQGYLVYQLTHDESKLAMVSFVGTMPVMLFGPLAGSLVDTLNRRMLLVLCQALLAVGALFLALGTAQGWITYPHILGVAFVGGLVGCVEMPTRQSIVGRVVPRELLSTAVPINGMTFNLARLVGSAIGGILLAKYGPEACYTVNGLSFVALIFAGLAIHTDLSAAERGDSGILSLIQEGLLFTYREKRLRTLLILECMTSAFGIAYMPMLPAIALDRLGLDRMGLGNAYSMIGVGAMIALGTVTLTAASRTKGKQIIAAMFVMGVAIIFLANTRDPRVAFPLLAVLGLCAILQFNSTNTLMQLLSPESLRGRVIAMHVWALSGLGPIGTLGIGLLATRYGIDTALTIGGSVVLVFAAWGFTQRRVLANEHPTVFSEKYASEPDAGE